MLSRSLPCWFRLILSAIVVPSLEKKELAALLFFGLWLYIVCHGLFALPLDVIGRLCSVIVVLPGYLVYCFSLSNRVL